MDVNPLEHLDDQYVLTIQNEGQWYREAVRLLQDGRIAKFMDLTAFWIGKVGRQRGENPKSRAYTYVTMRLYDGLIDSGDISAAHPYPRAFSDLKREIQEHLKKSNAIFEGVGQKLNQAIQETKEKNAMNNIPFITKNYVFGQDVETMTEEELIAAIKRMEGEIAELKSVKTPSKKIDQRVKDAQEMLAKIVEKLDSK